MRAESVQRQSLVAEASDSFTSASKTSSGIAHEMAVQTLLWAFKPFSIYEDTLAIELGHLV